MRSGLLLFFIVFTIFRAHAQKGKEVTGEVLDSAGLYIEGVTVRLTSPQDTLITGTNGAGKFRFKQVKSPVFRIDFYSLGYSPASRSYDVTDTASHIALKTLILKSEPVELNEVAIWGTPDILLKGDTVEYSTRHIVLDKYALTKDLLKKLPGMRVDMKGNLFIHDKPISKVRVNGVDFFGGNVALALQNLPADVIEKLQVIDDYGQIATLTGIKEGSPEKILNLVVDEKRNKGFFSNNTLGGGTSNIYQLQGGANVFKGPKQLGIFLARNNGNIPIMQYGLVHVNPGETNPGLNTSTSGGLRFSDASSTKFKGHIDYGFLENERHLLSNTYSQQSFSNAQETVSNSDETLITDKRTHSLTTELSYHPDAKTLIRFSPSISFSNSNSLEESMEDYQLFKGNEKVSHQAKTTTGIKTGSDNQVGLNFMANRRLNDKGRVVAFFGNMNLNESTGRENNENLLSLFYNTSDQIKDSIQSQEIHQKDNRQSAYFNLTYLEPLGKTGKLEITFSQRISYTKNKRTVFDSGKDLRLIDSLSNFGQNDFSESNLKVNYRFQTKKSNYTVGLNGLNTRTKGNFGEVEKENSRTSFNIVPHISAQWGNFNSSWATFDYLMRASSPTINQLNPVIDRRNPQNITTGNPELNTQFIHNTKFRFRRAYLSTGRYFEASAGGQYYQDKITSKIFLSRDPNGFLIRKTSFENLSGDYVINADYRGSIPVVKDKYIFTIDGNAELAKQYFFDEEVKRFSNIMRFAQGATFQLNITDRLNLYPNLSYSLTKTSNAINNEALSKFEVKVEGAFNFFRTYAAEFTFNKNFNEGYGGTTRVNPAIINLSLTKTFFKDKSGVLKLTGHDLLDQNVGISRYINTNSTIDKRENSIGRYVHFSYSQRLNNFF